MKNLLASIGVLVGAAGLGLALAHVEAAFGGRAAGGGQPAGPRAASATARYLVLVSIDACHPDYFDLVDTPNIRRLMAEGVTYTDA